MIDLKAVGSGANGTMAVLPRVQRLDVGDGEGAAVVLLARSVGGEVNPGHRTNMFDVLALPFLVALANSFWMLLSVTLVGVSMGLRIIGAQLTLVGRLVSWASLKPALGLFKLATHATSVCREAWAAMSVLAWLSAIVMPIATLLRGGTFRGHLAGSVEAQRFLPIAQDAVSGARPSIRQMAVSARFAGIVSGLARGFRSGSLWHGSHTFTVIRFA